MRLRAVFFALCICLLATVALAADVKFTLTWEPVAADINGNPATPDGYRVYACEEPISSTFSDAISIIDLVGNCNSSLTTYDVSHQDFVAASNEFQDIYHSSADKGTLYFRVSAYVMTPDGAVESELSNEDSGAYFTVVYFPAISTLRILGPVVVQP